MIANITKGNQLSPIFEYNEKKVKEGSAERFETINVFDDNHKTSERLMLNFSKQSGRKNKFFHVSLNFKNEDFNKLSKSELSDIVKEYMLGMGFPKSQPIAVYKHNDTLNPHLHVITTRIRKDGSFVNDFKDRNKSQSITRELEKKYNLKEVSSIKNQKPEPLKTLKPNSSLKDIMSYHIKYALHIKKVISLQDLQSYLILNNLNFESQKGTYKGKDYKGLVYYVDQSNFKEKQKGIKASSFNFKPTLDNIEKVFVKNKDYHKQTRKTIKTKIDTLIGYYSQMNYYDFQTKLKASNIDFQFKKDSQNNLVGLSFKDLNSNTKYTGEKIGKNYTSRNLSHWLTDSETAIKPKIAIDNEILKYNSLNKIDDNLKILLNMINLGFIVERFKGITYLGLKNNPKAIVPYSKYKINDKDSEKIKTYKNFLKGHYLNDNDIIYNAQRIKGIPNNDINFNDKNFNKDQIDELIDALDNRYKDFYEPYDSGEYLSDTVDDLDRSKAKRKRKGRRR